MTSEGVVMGPIVIISGLQGPTLDPGFPSWYLDVLPVLSNWV